MTDKSSQKETVPTLLDTPPLINIKTVEVKKEQSRLLSLIRGELVRHPSVELRSKDILPEFLLELSNEELQNILNNVELQKRQQSSLLNSKGLIQGLNILTEYITEDTLTIEKAIEDEQLNKDMTELIQSYVGDVPLVARVGIKLMSHLDTKKNGAKGKDKKDEK